jgi:hypothetical protein
MSFATMVTAIRTTDVESVDLEYAAGTSIRVQAAGAWTLVWRFHDFITRANHHHLAPVAAKKWGEAFYVGTDTVVSCLGYAHYVREQSVRTLYFMDMEEDVECAGEGKREAWEDALGVPPLPFDLENCPSGEGLFFGILKHHGCPPRPEPDPTPALGEEKLIDLLCDVGRPAYERRRALDHLFAKDKEILARLGDQLPRRPAPSDADWKRMSNDVKIVRACSLEGAVDPRSEIATLRAKYGA